MFERVIFYLLVCHLTQIFMDHIDSLLVNIFAIFCPYVTIISCTTITLIENIEYSFGDSAPCPRFYHRSLLLCKIYKTKFSEVLFLGPSVTMNSTVQIKKWVCKGHPFCANNVWNDGVVLVCTVNKHLGRLYFCFQELVYIY